MKPDIEDRDAAAQLAKGIDLQLARKVQGAMKGERKATGDLSRGKS